MLRQCTAAHSSRLIVHRSLHLHVVLAVVLLAMSSASPVRGAALARHPRELMQVTTSTSGCSVTVGSNAAAYAACSSLTGLEAALDLYWDFDITSRLLTGAIQGSSSSGWFGFGLTAPGSPGQMVGSNAVVVKANSTAASGASVDGYYLAAQYSAAVQPPFNGLTLLSGEAAASASALAATFSFVLPTTYNASALDFIYAYGPLSADGSVAQHAPNNAIPGGTIDLTQGAAATVAPSPAASPATSPAAVAASPSPAVSAPSPAADAAAVGPSPSTAGTPVTTSSTCTKSVAGVSTTYAACSALAANFNGGYNMFWTVQQSTSATLLHVAYSSATSDGFVGWGIPATPGVMVGGNGVIVKNNASAARGASVNSYHLGGYVTSAVTPPSQLDVVAMSADSTDGVLSAAFTLNLSAANVAKLSAFDIIYSQGSLDSSGDLVPHPASNGMSARVDLTAGTSSTSVVQTATAAPASGVHDPLVHGYLSAVSVGLLLPLSIVLARNFKELNPTWFHFHRILGVLAWLLGIVGVALGANLDDNAFPVPTIHKAFGGVVIALVSVQMASFIFRPSATQRWRSAWALTHAWIGRIGVGLAIANVYIGLSAAHQSAHLYIGYSAILGVIVLLGLTKESIDTVRFGVKDHTSLAAKGVMTDRSSADGGEQFIPSHGGKPQRSAPEQGGWLMNNRGGGDYLVAAETSSAHV